MLDVWSRSGAIAGRGFHYQDAVGAWFCALLLDGSVAADRLVPEGFEDLHLEADEPIFVQVKSRQEKRGSFSVGETLGFLEEMWGKHLNRVSEGIGTGRLMLVQERDVAGEAFSSRDEVLGDLPAAHPLVAGLSGRLPPEQVDSILRLTTLVTLDWQAAQAEAVDAIVRATGTARAAAEVAERLLRVDVANAADRNANARDVASAATIDRSSARYRIDEVVGLLDREALERALIQGICVPVQFAADGTADDYYLGTSARPSHISAGLPAPMPEVVGQAIESMSAGKPVLLTGPSGVGKSTALWSAVYTRRDVVWYQVKRISPNAIGAVIDLLRSMSPSYRNQIGLVVDGVGTSELVDWDELREATSHFEGVMLLGSVRHEDLVGVRNRADCAILEVTLTEAIAASLHANLRERELTDVPHWREALGESHGLTMEFTYLLTRGRRLQDVLRDQVMVRIRERRESELRVLALAATASRWGLPVPISALSAEISDPVSLRDALLRLVEEHLVQISDGAVGGLHPLRSRFLSESLHETPPPTLADTVSSLVRLLPDTGLPALFAGISRDLAHALPFAIDALVQRVRETGARDLVAALRAVRLVDLEQRSTRWIEILERHAVPLPKRLFTLQLALVDTDLEVIPLPENVSSAIAELREISFEPFEELTNLVQSTGVELVAGAVFDTRTPGDVIELLGELQGIAGRLLLALVGSLERLDANGRRIVAFEAEPALEELAEVLLTARSLDDGIAEMLLRLSGGVNRIIERLVDRFRWATAITVVNGAEGQVFTGQLFHISDELQGDADSNAKELARLGIACIPGCVSADVRTVSADGLQYEIGGQPFGISTLQRRYVHARSSVDLNQQTASFAAARLFGASLTERLTIGMSGLTLADSLLRRIAVVWLRGENRPAELVTLHEARVELDALATQLVPVADSLTGGRHVPIADNLHTLLTGIAVDLPDRLANPVNHRALAMYTSETLVDAAKRSGSELWEMIDQSPLDLIDNITTQLEALASVIDEVAVGGTSPRDLRQAARSGNSENALGRAADLAARNAIRRGNREQELRLGAIRGLGLSAVSYQRSTSRVHEAWPPLQFAVGVKVSNVVEWLTKGDAVMAALAPAADGPGYRPPLLVFPEIAGRRISNYGMRVIRSTFPIVGGLEEWADGLPPAWETPRSDAFKVAQHALMVLSGLGTLSRLRSVASHPAAAESAHNQFAAAREFLGGYRDEITEALVAHLDATATTVSHEANWSVEADLSQTYAAQLMGLVRGVETPTGREATLFAHIAIQADIDLDVARSLVT